MRDRRQLHGRAGAQPHWLGWTGPIVWIAVVATLTLAFTAGTPAADSTLLARLLRTFKYVLPFHGTSAVVVVLVLRRVILVGSPTAGAVVKLYVTSLVTTWVAAGILAGLVAGAMGLRVSWASHRTGQLEGVRGFRPISPIIYGKRQAEKLSEYQRRSKPKVPGFEPGGRRFESFRARHFAPPIGRFPSLPLDAPVESFASFALSDETRVRLPKSCT